MKKPGTSQNHKRFYPAYKSRNVFEFLCITGVFVAFFLAVSPGTFTNGQTHRLHRIRGRLGERMYRMKIPSKARQQLLNIIRHLQIRKAKSKCSGAIKERCSFMSGTCHTAMLSKRSIPDQDTTSMRFQSRISKRSSRLRRLTKRRPMKRPRIRVTCHLCDSIC